MASENSDGNMDPSTSDLKVPKNVSQPNEERLHSPLLAPSLPMTMMTCTTDKELKEQMEVVSKINPALCQINNIVPLTDSTSETSTTPSNSSTEDILDNSRDTSYLAKKETLSMEPVGLQSPSSATKIERREGLKSPSMLRELELSESDEDMVMVMEPTANHRQATRGCARCYKDACCPTIHAMDFFTPSHSKEEIHTQFRREEREFTNNEPHFAIREMAEMKKNLEIIERQVEYDDPQHQGPFCCNKLFLDHRGSSPIVSGEKKAIIAKFIRSANDNVEITYDAFSSDEDYQACWRLFKVNVVKNHEEVSSWLFTPSGIYDVHTKYFCVMQLPKDDILRFNTAGPFEWCKYWCKEHKLGFKVGVQDKRTANSGEWESFGEYYIDSRMRLPMREFVWYPRGLCGS